MSLQSRLFAGDAKLETVAGSDTAQIRQGEVGPHVVRIQSALIRVASAEIRADGRFGPKTAAVLQAYLHQAGGGPGSASITKAVVLALDKAAADYERSAVVERTGGHCRTGTFDYHWTLS